MRPRLWVLFVRICGLLRCRIVLTCMQFSLVRSCVGVEAVLGVCVHLCTLAFKSCLGSAFALLPLFQLLVLASQGLSLG